MLCVGAVFVVGLLGILRMVQLALGTLVEEAEEGNPEEDYQEDEELVHFTFLSRTRPSESRLRALSPRLPQAGLGETTRTFLRTFRDERPKG